MCAPPQKPIFDMMNDTKPIIKLEIRRELFVSFKEIPAPSASMLVAIPKISIIL